MKRRKYLAVLSAAAITTLLTTSVFAANGDVYKLADKSLAYNQDQMVSFKNQKYVGMRPSQYGYEYNGKVYKLEDVNKVYAEEKEAGNSDLTEVLNKVSVNKEAAFPVEEEEQELKVESVSAINAKEVKVVFNQEVKKDSVITPTTNIVKGISTFTALDNNNPTGTQTNNVTIASLTGVLSKDGKTLTITADSGKVFEGRYHIVIENVENTKSEKMEKYDEVVDLGKDTIAPAIKSVEKVDAATTKVTFTEAIANLGTGTTPGTGLTYSAKLADGKTASVTVTAATDGKSINVKADATKYAGKTIAVTMLGAKDHAGNLIKPNPSTFNIEVGEKDGVAPTVASVKALSDTQIEVVFSEEVQNFATTVAADANSRVTLTGESGKIATVTATKIEQDKTDKKKYVVTLSGTALDGATESALADLKIKKTITLIATGTSTITDLSGEEMKDDYTTIVTVKKDTVAPKLVSSKVVKDANGQWLEIKFDKELDSAVGTAVAVDGTDATAYKDYVTTIGAFAFGGTNDELTTDNDGVRIKLDEATFGGDPLVDGTKYTFDVKAKGANGKTSDAIEIEFTYEGQASTDKPEVDETSPLTGQDTVKITFNKELDGASATNVANYKIDGVEVKKAVLAPVASGKQTVTLTLGKNELSGNRAITISGIKSKDGVEMDKFEGTVVLTENVKPTVIAAKVTSTKTIEVTFSENVDITGGTDDFVLYIGDSKAEGTFTTAAVTKGDKVVITLSDALTEEALGKTLTLKAGTKANVIKDEAGNVLDFEEIVVTK